MTETAAVQMIPVEDISLSPLNPRSDLGDVAESRPGHRREGGRGGGVAAPSVTQETMAPSWIPGRGLSRFIASASDAVAPP
jgi:hypothetical protein